MESTRQVPSTTPAASGGSCVVTPLDERRVRLLKPAYTTRHVHRLLAADPRRFGLVAGPEVVPRPGDVVLARVLVLGQHPRLETPASRRATLFEGDEILVAYGARYAPDQFEAGVPLDLGTTSLVAAGGVAGDVLAAHSLMRRATSVEPLGLLAGGGRLVTLQQCAPYALGSADSATVHPGRPQPAVVAVLGTSMNSGKTTAAAAIVRGLTQAGMDVAAGKVTGTGAGGDLRLYQDSGATVALDFTDYGYASTYQVAHDEVRSLYLSLLDDLAATAPDVIVLEIADGLYQQETSALIQDPVFGQRLDHLVFAAGEALGANAGLRLLAGYGLRPTAVSGLVTASPLASRELERTLGVPVLDIPALSSPALPFLLGLDGAGAPEARREHFAG